jgi:hypothetical protein
LSLPVSACLPPKTPPKHRLNYPGNTAAYAQMPRPTTPASSIAPPSLLPLPCLLLHSRLSPNNNTTNASPHPPQNTAAYKLIIHHTAATFQKHSPLPCTAVCPPPAAACEGVAQRTAAQPHLTPPVSQMPRHASRLSNAQTSTPQQHRSLHRMTAYPSNATVNYYVVHPLALHPPNTGGLDCSVRYTAHSPHSLLPTTPPIALLLPPKRHCRRPRRKPSKVHQTKRGLLSSLTFALGRKRAVQINALAAQPRLKPSKASQAPLPPPIFACGCKHAVQANNPDASQAKQAERLKPSRAMQTEQSINASGGIGAAANAPAPPTPCCHCNTDAPTLMP